MVVRGHIPPLIVRVVVGISEEMRPREDYDYGAGQYSKTTHHASVGKVLSDTVISTGACGCMKKKFKILQFLNETMSEESRMAEEF